MQNIGVREDLTDMHAVLHKWHDAVVGLSWKIPHTSNGLSEVPTVFNPFRGLHDSTGSRIYRAHSRCRQSSYRLIFRTENSQCFQKNHPDDEGGRLGNPKYAGE